MDVILNEHTSEVETNIAESCPNAFFLSSITSTASNATNKFYALSAGPEFVTVVKGGTLRVALCDTWAV